MKKVFLLIVALVLHSLDGVAQCAMCKTTIVNNVSHGELSLAEGLNFGIMYLFVTPYLAVLVIGILWFRKSKRNAKKNVRRSTVGM